MPINLSFFFERDFKKIFLILFKFSFFALNSINHNPLYFQQLDTYVVEHTTCILNQNYLNIRI